MIRGIKPQAYDSVNKTTDKLLIPAAAVDFTDEENLESKIVGITENISLLQSQTETLGSLVNKRLPVPKQIGTLVYNGEIQTPFFDINSSRIVISGETEGTDAKEYRAFATIQNGSWQDESLNIKQPVKWKIVKKKIPKPFVNSTIYEDGTLQTVKLANYNESYCKITGTAQERFAGLYSINVEIVNSNIVWEDGSSSVLTLFWRILEKPAGGTVTSTIPLAVTMELSSLNNMLRILERNVEENREDIDKLLNGEGNSNSFYDAIINSLKRRLELLEFFFAGSDLGDFDMGALISLLTNQVEQLEHDAADLSLENLTAEADALIKLIDKALEHATENSDVAALNSLKERIQALNNIKEAQEQLKAFSDELKDNKKQIDNLLDNNDIDSAKEQLVTIKQQWSILLDELDPSVKVKIQGTIDNIDKVIDDLEKKIIRKEIQNMLSDIADKISVLQQKLINGENVASLISEIQDLIRTVKTKLEDYDFPFEQDRLRTLEETFDDIMADYDVSQTVQNLITRVQTLKNNLNSYSNEIIAEELDSIETGARGIKNIVMNKNDNTLKESFLMLEDTIAEVKDLFWKKQKETVVDDIISQLNSILEAVNNNNYDSDDVVTWTNTTKIFDRDLAAIKDTANDKHITVDNLAEAEDLLTTVTDLLVTTGIRKILDDINDNLDSLEEQMQAGIVTYDFVKSALDDISEQLTDLEDDSLPAEAKDIIRTTKARVISLRQLNEDMKIYLEVKPILDGIRQKIYDEDLDVLWEELNTAEELVKKGSNSVWTTKLKSEIADIKHILNSFSTNNTVSNFLQHLDMAVQIIVTLDEFSTNALSYDQARENLEQLEQLSVSMESNEPLSFPGWYSLSEQDKAYMLENNLRKLRRNVITIEETA